MFTRVTPQVGPEPLVVYSGNGFRKREAGVIKVGEGDQVGGIDITIPLDGLHTIRGVVTAKRDGHAVSKARVALSYADDRELVRSVDTEEDGSFEFSYVPAGQYILKTKNAVDIEKVDYHKYNSNWTEDVTTRKYGDAELPVMVTSDVIGAVLAAPDLTPTQVPSPGAIKSQPSYSNLFTPRLAGVFLLLLCACSTNPALAAQ